MNSYNMSSFIWLILFRIMCLKYIPDIAYYQCVIFLPYCWVCHCYLVAKSCPTLCNPRTAAHQTSLSFTISWSLLKLISIESVMSSNHLILCHPLHLLPSIFPSIRVFPNELALRIRQPKYWSFSFSISPSSKYSELISFRIDWLDCWI